VRKHDVIALPSIGQLTVVPVEDQFETLPRGVVGHDGFDRVGGWHAAFMTSVARKAKLIRGRSKMRTVCGALASAPGSH
jgi:hypothetical protein